MKNRAFRKFVASIGVAAMVVSTATNAMSPAVTRAESAQELEGQQNDSQEQGGQEDPVAQSSDDTNGAPFADAEPMAVSSEGSQDSQEAAGPSESSDSNGENGTEGSSGENTNASAGSTSTDASGAGSQDATGTMSGATNGTVGTTNSTITGTTNDTAGTINGATDTFANGTSTDASTGTTTGENGEASGDNAEASTKEITSVITEDIDLGTYPAGEAPAYAQLELPDEIEVKVDEEKQTVTVTWNGEETYHPDQAGTYIFSSELDKEWNKDENGNARYQLAEKVELPKASVRVEKKAESTEDSKAEVKSDNKTENKTDAKLDIKEDNKTDAKADNKSEGKTEEKSDNKSEVTTKPETTKATTKGTSKENTKETSKKDSASKDKTKDETEDETKGEAKNEAKEENKTDTKDETAKADQKKKVTNAASLKAVYVAEDGTILCGTVGLTGDSFTISDKAKSFNGYELKTVTLGEEELPQDTVFTRNTSTTETKEEIRTEASYTYTMDGAEHEIAAGDTATITFTYAQKEEVTPEIASIEVTGEAVDTTGAAIQGDYAFPLAVGTNDLSKTAPYIQGYEYQYAEIGTDKITSIAKEVLEAGKYAYYVDGELLKENTKITYVYQEDEDYTEQLSADCGDVSVTLSATKDAKIPKNAKLVVNAITGDRLRSALSMSADAMGVTADKVYGTACDIYLEADGNRIQPSEHVHVTMSFHNPVSLNLPDKAQVAKSAVIHIHDGSASEVSGTAGTDGSSVTGAEFDADSFSIYVNAYTVDFHYNGLTYSMKGNGAVKLSEVMKAVDIQKDVAEVKSAIFTNPELLKVEKDTEGNDWTLTSLQSFTSDEILTVTMEDGTVYTIAVTDPNANYQVTGDPRLALNDLTSSIQVTTKTGEIDRNAEVDFNLNYAIDDNKLGSTIKTNKGNSTVIHNVWEYDLSAMKELKLTEGSKGSIYDGNTKAGQYEITNNKIIFTVDPQFLYDHTTGVKGTFTFKAKLNKNEIGSKKEIDLQFPGESQKTHLEFKNVYIESWKKCDNGNGTVNVTTNADGSLTLNYSVHFKADVALDSLKMYDTLTGQAYDLESFKIATGDDWNWISVPDGALSFNGNNVEVDVKKALGIKEADKLDADTVYEIKYSTTVKAEDIGKEVTNRAKWNYDGTSTTDSETKVTPHKKLTITKNVEEKDNEYIYTIVAGGDGINMKGHIITDEMSDNQVLISSITISPAVNGITTIAPAWTNDRKYSEQNVKLFEFHFPADQDCISKYTITYKTKAAESDDLSGKQNIKNTVQDEHGDDKGSASSENKEHNFGIKKTATVQKKWTGWDTESNPKGVIWSVDVTLPEGVSSLNNVVVTEKSSKYDTGANAQWNRYKNLTIDISNISVKKNNGVLLQNEIDYFVDNEKKTITFPNLSENVTIEGIRSVCPNDFDYTAATEETWFENTVGVSVDGRSGNESTAIKRYQSSNWTMSKGVSYDKSTDIYTWTVIVNPEKAIFEEDKDLIFEDDIPTGMQMIGQLKVNAIGIDIKGNNNFWGLDNYINVEGITGSYQGNITDIWKKASHASAPNGISGVRYTITYQTKLTDDALDQEKGNTAVTTYTNVARVKGEDGAELNSAQKDITRTYHFLTKTDVSNEDLGSEKDVIEYKIVINPDHLPLNDGKQLTLTDTLPEGTSFISNGYELDPAEGTSVSLNSSTRELKVKVPDATTVTFTYKIKSDDLYPSGHIFKNTAVLSGKGLHKVVEEKKHIIREHSSTIEGANNSVTIHKYDEDKLATSLQDAKFTLYSFEADQNGILSADPKTAANGCTDQSGKFVFQDLNFVDQNSAAPYTVYKLVETKAPDGYEISEAYAESNGYYFVLYDGDRGKAEEVSRRVKEKNGISVEVVSGGSTLDISNKKMAVGNLKLTKIIGGKLEAKDLTDDQKKAITFTITGPDKYSKTVKYSEFKEGSYTLSGLKEGEYRVTESGAGIEGYDLTTSYNVTDGKAMVTDGQTTEVTVTNTYSNGGLTIVKTFSGDTTKLTEAYKSGLTFTITGPGNYSKTVTYSEFTEGSYTLDNLRLGEYTVTESNQDLTGYTVTTTYKVGETEKQNVQVTKEGGTVQVTNTYHEKTGNLKLTKIIGGKLKAKDLTEDQKKAITFTITGPDKYSKTVKYSEFTEGSYTLSGLKEGEYQVTESGAGIEGYDLTTSYNVTDGKATVTDGQTPEVIVTNTYRLITTQIIVSKSWSDDNNRDNKRPDSIEVKLVAKVDGSEIEVLSSGTQKLNGANGWKYTFTDLPKYHAGKLVEYTVEEVNTPAGYTKTITGNVTDGFNITNTYTPEKVQVSGSKNWNDDGNAAGTRPGSITIRLYANGSEIDHKTVTEKDGWSWNWTGLNRYDTDHKEISYTISEDAVDGYTSSISGYNVTNTVNKPQVGSVILTKVDATTGTALAGAVFDLYRANNTKVGTYTTNAGGVLRVDGLTFGDYYFVETKAPEGYALESQRAAFTINAATTVSAPASVRVTNKPVDEKIGVSAAKVWDDENNTDGVRPSSVTFRLFADGVEIGSAQASEANGWTVSFGNLPKTRNGVAISYAVKEDEVGNYYEASYETGLGSDGSYVFTVKNYRETDKHYEERTGSVRGANRNKPSNGGVAGAGRGRGTGDESDMTVYGTVSGASLLALIVWMIARRKRAGKGTK